MKMQSPHVYLVLPADAVAESAGSLTAFAVQAGFGQEPEALVLRQGGDARFQGLKKVTVLDNGALGPANPEGAAQVLEEFMGKELPDLVLFDDSRFSQQIAVRLAAGLGLPIVTHVTDLTLDDAGVTVHKKVYSGSLVQGYRCAGPMVLTVDLTTQSPVIRDESVPVEVRKVTVAEDDARYLPSSNDEGPDLATARVVVAGGRGLQSEDGVNLVNRLARQLDGAVGASRAAVDEGWFEASTMVGQSGKTVAPDLYIAAGISGTIQHTVGMDQSKCVVAINLDPEAPIFNLADFGLVEDAGKALNELLDKTGAQGADDADNL